MKLGLGEIDPKDVKPQKKWPGRHCYWVRDFGTYTGSYCRNKYNQNFNRKIWLNLAWFFWGVESWGEYLIHGTDSDFGREAKRVTIPRLKSILPGVLR